MHQFRESVMHPGYRAAFVGASKPFNPASRQKIPKAKVQTPNNSEE
jgi:hypothetical protein